MIMVRKERLELSHLAVLEPKSSASTNSATFALILLLTWVTPVFRKFGYPKGRRL